MNMNDEERRSLASLYAKWETASLNDAVTRRPGEYDPQALELMAQELAKRAVPAHEFQSFKVGTVRTPQPIAPSVRLRSGERRPYIQYVGAWGLNILLTFAMTIPLAILLRGTRPHGQGEALFAMLFGIVIGASISLLAFWLSVKWMIVDRLSQQLRGETTQDEAHRDRDAPCGAPLPHH
ncbi:MAG: hypothetical protein FJY85_19775 [Deltaproteobacteria bacterium]|nr:hypothetical protein [Deltaproteobacteria bacterium]